jgi:hypothetical protein
MKKKETLPPKARLGLEHIREDYNELVRLRQAVQAAEAKLASGPDSQPKKRQTPIQRR